jgi:hypothetical protein
MCKAVEIMSIIVFFLDLSCSMFYNLFAILVNYNKLSLFPNPVMLKQNLRVL